MKSYIILPISIFFSTIIFAQTPISGIINQYYAITNIDYCLGKIDLTSSTGLSVGDQVLIIQMQGATMNVSETTAFGNITNLAGAGLFERAQVNQITGNSIFLANLLLNQYDIVGKVQLVKIPVFPDAVVTDTLKAMPWNGTTGGVLALEVTGQLTLNAPIDASGVGFRGGTAGIVGNNVCNGLTNIQGYAYGLNNWRAARKGEGIAAYIIGKEAGRGAQTNGGGGGNDHNSGGGGGGNLAPGGTGGRNKEPSILRCSGIYPGVGGKAIAGSENRIFMGGGGGAGHDNNLSLPNGGDGGGIIIIQANNITGNGQSISANGESPALAQGDGGSGGGGGGSIRVMIGGTLNNVNIQANGGKGSDVENTNQPRCFGAGGGGSGGEVQVNSGAVVSVLGGKAGVSINSILPTCATDLTAMAEDGVDGTASSNVIIPQSNIAIAPPTIIDQPADYYLCDFFPDSIPVVVSPGNFNYQWELEDATGNFVPLMTGNDFNGVNSPTLIVESATFKDSNIRLRVFSDCYPPVFSNVFTLRSNAKPLADFAFESVDGTVNFLEGSAGGEMFAWNFGDGQSSIEEDPVHTYATAGIYDVTLTVSNRCGSDSITKQVKAGRLPKAAFTATPTSGCAPISVSFTNQTTDAASYSWIFPGGSPATSNQATPTVLYDRPGSYTVTLIASNIIGVDTLTVENIVVVNDEPEVAFTYAANQTLVAFTNKTMRAQQVSWDFGDGQTSLEVDPVHQFSVSNFYTVTLTATNECGTATFTDEVLAAEPLAAQFNTRIRSGCAPMSARFTNNSRGQFDSQVWTFQGGNPGTSTDPSPLVRYDLPGKYDVTLSVKGPFGENTVTSTDYIEVFPGPKPEFSFSLNGLSVQFTNLSQAASSYQWSFGDKTYSNETNPSHTYTTPGIYSVTLNAQNAACAVAYAVNVWVK